MKALFMYRALMQTNIEMDATYDIHSIPTLTFGLTNGDENSVAQIHRIVASIGHRLAKTQSTTTDQNDDELDHHDDECECCQCNGHDWVALDNGETHECRYCNADITLNELDALYATDY